jgi:type I restriction enzyme, S subunit
MPTTISAENTPAATDLPALSSGWEWTTLGEVTSVNQRDADLRTLPDTTEITFVPMAAVDAESGSIQNSATRMLGQVRKGFTSFAEGDVLFAKITPCMENGKAAIAKGLVSQLGFGPLQEQPDNFVFLQNSSKNTYYPCRPWPSSAASWRPSRHS